MEKGYEGSADFWRALIPRKKPINGGLATEDIWTNSKISSDRVIVELFWPDVFIVDGCGVKIYGMNTCVTILYAYLLH